VSELAIRAEGLSKLYELGELKRYSALRDTLARAVAAPWTFFQREKKEKFWALENVDLQVKHGEVIGLVGRNGAGKTTLLKILSRITKPTRGWAEIYGRVGSLLEIGTGFHPELSGRDNIFLSGAILGMSKREIAAKFDEIVAFAEIEKFLDTQVKHYSSGMYVRLAFAVAAHLEPEILLVDEVLAVGDIKFQKKCLGKMGDVAKAGRTVVLVSHQMNQIRRLCNRAVWMDRGGVRRDGNTSEVLGAYETAMFAADSDTEETRKGVQGAKFLQWSILGARDRGDGGGARPEHILRTAGSFRVEFVVELRRPIRNGEHGIALYNAERQLMWGWAVPGLSLEAGVHTLSHEFPSLPLRPGSYQWQVDLGDENEQLDSWDCNPEMVIETEQHQHYMDEWNGVLNVPSTFRHRAGDEDGRKPGARTVTPE
jgi:ABC-type polysaccharide/polyol phosphate transport system ATPase subunit